MYGIIGRFKLSFLFLSDVGAILAVVQRIKGAHIGAPLQIDNLEYTRIILLISS